MMLNFKSLFLSLMVCFAWSSSLAVSGYAGPARKPLPRFTSEEIVFLKNIAQKATTLIQKNLDTTEYQLNCLKNPNQNDCPSEQIKNAIKGAYSQYRSYYVMTEYDYFITRTTGRAIAHNGNKPIPLSTDYSNSKIYINQFDRIRLSEIRNADLEFLEANKENCNLNKENLLNHYQKQIANIITTTPVVLMIQTQNTLPSDEEIVAGFENLLIDMRTTLENFTHYDSSKLEGLWSYQMLAMSLAKENPSFQKIFDQLKIKIEPQNALQSFGYWFKKTFTFYNMLFIGCAAVAFSTSNPLIGMACTAANSVSSGYNLYIESLAIDEKRSEWISGVDSFDAITEANVQMQFDTGLFVLSLIGVRSLYIKTKNLPNFKTPAMVEYVRNTLTGEHIVKNAAKYPAEFAKNNAKDELKSFIANFLTAHASTLLSHEEIQQITPGLANLIFRINQKGLYTFKDSATAICRAQKLAVKD